MSCVVFLNPNATTCSKSELTTIAYDNFVFFPLLWTAGSFFFIVTARRVYILREKFNTFYFMMIPINIWLPCHLIYYICHIYLQYTENKVSIPLISFTQWGGYVFLGLSFCPLVAAWSDLNQADKKFATYRSVGNWSYFLVIESVIFGVTTILTSILMGYDKLYDVAARIYFGTWTFHLFHTSFLLVLAAYNIHNKLKDCKHAVCNTSDDALSNLKSKIVAVILMVFAILIPAGIGTLCHTILLLEIDSHAWSVGVVLSLYRTCATAYVFFWAFMFLNETNVRIVRISRTTLSSPVSTM